jgi:hypothetical protein
VVRYFDAALAISVARYRAGLSASSAALSRFARASVPIVHATLQQARVPKFHRLTHLQVDARACKLEPRLIATHP